MTLTPSRRYFLVFAAVSTALAAGAEPASRPDDVVVTGKSDPRLEPFDRLMKSFLADRKVPGAALAISKAGRLVYARGFGVADLETGGPVLPDALFRIASLSKPVTAVAVMALVERGKLSLDDLAVDRLGPEHAGKERPPNDPRWSKITLRHLLQHRGGWDRDVSFDPMFRAVTIAEEFGVAPPAGPTEVIHYMLQQPLDFDPGARYAYSNFGYCVLGRVIERATGAPYEKAVEALVLRPLGIPSESMTLGKTLVDGRAPNEVTYHDDGRTAPSVFPPLGRRVPGPYGAWNIEAMDAHGGWIASAPAMLRFARAIDDPDRAKVIGKESVATMFERPPGAAGFESDGPPKKTYYALGWNVRPVGDRGANTWHTGSLPGTSTLLVRRRDGLSWAVLFNARDGADGKVLSGAIDPMLHQAADAVREWPEGDLFPGAAPREAAP